VIKRLPHNATVEQAAKLTPARIAAALAAAALAAVAQTEAEAPTDPGSIQAPRSSATRGEN